MTGSLREHDFSERRLSRTLYPFCLTILTKGEAKPAIRTLRSAKLPHLLTAHFMPDFSHLLPPR